MEIFVFVVRLDLDKKILAFDLDIPRLRIDAQYNLKGNILLLPLVGNGNVAMTMKGVKSTVTTKISIRKLPEVYTESFNISHPLHICRRLISFKFHKQFKIFFHTLQTCRSSHYTAGSLIAIVFVDQFI